MSVSVSVSVVSVSGEWASEWVVIDTANYSNAIHIHIPMHTYKRARTHTRTQQSCPFVQFSVSNHPDVSIHPSRIERAQKGPNVLKFPGDLYGVCGVGSLIFY